MSPAAERQRQTSAHYDNAAVTGLAQRAQTTGRSSREGPTARAHTRRGGSSDGRQSSDDNQEPPSTSTVRHTDSQARSRGGREASLATSSGIAGERSPTPMGNLLHGSQAVLLWWARAEEAATLGNRVRLSLNYFSWLAATHEVSYTTSLEHFVGVPSGTRPTNRGALRNVNRASLSSTK